MSLLGNRCRGVTLKIAIKRRIRCLSALAACIGLSACATQPLPQGKALKYKTIGVLSTMGDRFEVKIVGTTAFGNKQHSRKLDLGADGLITQEVGRALSGKYTVSDLSKYRKPFTGQRKYWPGNKGIFSEDRPSVSQVVQRLMGAEGLDAYLLVTPVSARVGGSNQYVKGIGVVKRSHLFSTTYYRFFAAHMVSIIDGRDFSLVAQIRADPFDKKGLFDFKSLPKVRGPSVQIPANYIEAPSQYRDDLRNKLQSLIRRSVPDTLRRVNLLPQES